jgi:hypothetical protein
MIHLIPPLTPKNVTVSLVIILTELCHPTGKNTYLGKPNARRISGLKTEADEENCMSMSRACSMHRSDEECIQNVRKP